MLSSDQAILLVIDVQGKLARVVNESESHVASVVKLVEGAKLFELPILLTAQVPEKIGHTIPEVASLLPEQEDIPRVSFSVYCDEKVRRQIEKTGRKQALLCGFESHICLYQTSLDMLADGYEVYLVADAVSSRDPFNKTITLQELRGEGVHLTTVEMAFFAMLRDASHPQFKAIARLIR